MYRKLAALALSFLLCLFGLSTNVNSKDLSSASFRLQLSEEEIAIRKQQARETKKLRLIDPKGTKQTSYEEWMALQGTPLPFSTKLVLSSTQHRADSKICVLVNSDLYPSIETSVTQYVADLVVDGYTAEVHTLLGGTPQDLRGFLQSLHAGGMDGCLFIGDLPIAWYEESYDGPEVFPCDLYYMDLDGDFYDTDTDGLYDLHEGNKNPEIYVGRLTASPLTFGGNDEVTLVTNYFRKNHLFRTGGMNINNRGLAFIDDDWHWDGPWIKDCLEYIYCQAICYDEPNETVGALYKAELSDGYEFVHVAAHSNHGGNWFTGPGINGGGEIMNYELYDLDPPGIFYTLFACSNARFVETDYMGGWYIFTDSYGLAATGTTKTGSMLNFDQFYYPMGNGATIGEAYFIWWDEMANWGLDAGAVMWFYGNTLLGDPTLKPSERRPVELQDAVLPYCLKNRNYSFYLDADGGSAPPYNWGLINGQLPNGLTLNETEGNLSGQPTESGIFYFTVSAEDICNKQGSEAEPLYSDTLEYSVGIIGICGDANNSGIKDMDDVTDIINYLFNDGTNMCPVAAGDMDNFDGTNINDAYYLYEHISMKPVYPKCPPFTTSIPSAPENIIEIRNSTVRPDRNKHRVDFWLNSSSPAVSLSIPFEYSCATSPVVCDSITFGGSSYSHYQHKYGSVDRADPRAVIGIANTGENTPTENPARLASAWFSINPSSEEQQIIISSTSYGPNEFMIASPTPTAPYIPSIAVIPGTVFECGDATDDGGVNILDVIYLINFKYKGGPEPLMPESSNVNGDANIDILDIVYMINFLYKDGPNPQCM